MPTIVRRLEAGRIEVLFDRPVPEDSERGAGLMKLGELEDAHLLKEGGAITGVIAGEKDYMGYLRDVNASKDEIKNIRAALDESRKARRARMRG